MTAEDGEPRSAQTSATVLDFSPFYMQICSLFRHLTRVNLSRRTFVRLAVFTIHDAPGRYGILKLVICGL